MAIRIGIGSWADREYTGILYPKGLAADQRLKTYATWFDHVEVNSTYYATPGQATVATWVEQTPESFSFDVKLHRTFSQSPKKTAEGDLPDRVINAMRPLIEAKKLGAFLLVLPPSFGPQKHSISELEAVAEKFRPHPLAVELRHSGWVSGPMREETLGYFRERQIAWVAVDMPQVEGSSIMPAVDEATHPDLAYLRLHGRNKEWAELKTAEERHTYMYSDEELAELAARAKALAPKAKHVHVIANNHAQDFAPRTALALKKLL